MPSTERIAWARLRVGILAIVSIAIVFLLVFLLTGEKGFFTKTVPVYTFLDDSYALPRGAPVRLNGILVGQIDAVRLSGSSDPMRVIRIEMGIIQNSLKDIPEDSEVRISAENVLGSKYINIKRGQSAVTVRAEGELRSQDTRDFEDVVASGYNTLETLRELIKRVDAIVALIETGEGSIGKFIVDPSFYDRLVATMEEAEKVVKAVSSGRGTIGKLLYDEAIYDETRATIARLNGMIEKLEKGEGTAGRLLTDDSLFVEARSGIADLRTTIGNLNDGKGTMGKLLHDDKLYTQLNDLIAELDTTITKINTGQGTLGQLMVNPSMYESLDGMTRELHDLLKDFRANPRKFLRIKLALF
jgi:phospholipid/cholesterol/gamma-HCH transport system substrate-binding protein